MGMGVRELKLSRVELGGGEGGRGAAVLIQIFNAH